MNRLAWLAVAVFLGACGTSPDVCVEQKKGGAFCIPDGGSAPAGQKLSLEVLDSCQSACSSYTLSCVVTRDAGTVTLALAGKQCTPVAGGACPAICKISHFACEVPALEPGDYTVLSPDQPSQPLRVADGGVGNCTASPF